MYSGARKNACIRPMGKGKLGSENISSFISWIGKTIKEQVRSFMKTYICPMIFNSDYYPKQLGFIVLSTLVLLPLLTGSCKNKIESSTPDQNTSVAPDTLPG